VSDISSLVASTSVFWPLQTDQSEHDDRVNDPVGNAAAGF
jgi:hypothetical protein